MYWEVGTALKIEIVDNLSSDNLSPDKMVQQIWHPLPGHLLLARPPGQFSMVTSHARVVQQFRLSDCPTDRSKGRTEL